jgi:putative PIN family toxin of toxin-antitoxin system
LSAPVLAVLDTNVWLDLLVFDEPGVRPLREAIEARRLSACVDARALEELRRVLGYPLGRFSLDEAGRTRALEACRRLSILYEGPPQRLAVLPACRDRDDQAFLELARDCGAELLVTRDRDLLVLARRRGTPLPFTIVTPAAALAALQRPGD